MNGEGTNEFASEASLSTQKHEHSQNFSRLKTSLGAFYYPWAARNRPLST
ncbi:hypothetical protein PDIG_60280 [Penicillium digitatum PHI26]|uniref:Uncharacterized protein n=2 Tax=Penicillium digitatum TaxID=36651 RepID=K9FJF2_PEND2|nr:hypothetical protein PDIP_69690 [Penicillium digitatum Pd1]EKV08154.1 hypothetical protein PDIP_69690 [Penicillium digitatum Pd1]EKV09705.1 hypothetical protein PDIG_60280 [Penicillium digitatum PHI26]